MILDQFVNIALIVISSFMLLLGLYFSVILLKINHFSNEVYRRINDLRNGVTVDKIEDFIVYIDRFYYPSKSVSNNFIVAAYKIVELEGDIDENLKRDLKLAILSKGIIFN